MRAGLQGREAAIGSSDNDDTHRSLRARPVGMLHQEPAPSAYPRSHRHERPISQRRCTPVLRSQWQIPLFESSLTPMTDACGDHFGLNYPRSHHLTVPTVSAASYLHRAGFTVQRFVLDQGVGKCFVYRARQRSWPSFRKHHRLSMPTLPAWRSPLYTQCVLSHHHHSGSHSFSTSVTLALVYLPRYGGTYVGANPKLTLTGCHIHTRTLAMTL